MADGAGGAVVSAVVPGVDGGVELGVVDGRGETGDPESSLSLPQEAPISTMARTSARQEPAAMRGEAEVGTGSRP